MVEEVEAEVEGERGVLQRAVPTGWQEDGCRRMPAHVQGTGG